MFPNIFRGHSKLIALKFKGQRVLVSTSRVEKNLLEVNTHSHFTQVNPIVQRVPGTLLVVWPPGFLEDLANALTLLTFIPITARDAWCPWNAVGPWVTVPAWSACWSL